jgi:hypothetical protein
MLILILGSNLASAQSGPASKATMKMGGINILNKGSTGGFTTILKTQIKTSSQKDLMMNVALECGLLTRTKVSSKQGISDTSSAQASVKLRVMVDGREASPGEVVYCKRSQELSATFAGIMQSCTDTNADGTITQDECTWTAEELTLVLDTMNANSFNFGLLQVGTGLHNIEVQAAIESGTTVQFGAADANASIGKGSITVEEVRLIKDAVIDF